MVKKGDMENTLSYIAQEVSDCLKFAEAKAGTLLAGNGLVIFGVLRLVDQHQFAIYYLGFCLLLMAISMVICLLSFIPFKNTTWLLNCAEKSSEDNLLYFADIAKYTPEDYLHRLCQSKNIALDQMNAYENMLAQQVVVNSIIAKRKFKLFTCAVWITMSAVLTPIVTFILYKCANQQKNR